MANDGKGGLFARPTAVVNEFFSRYGQRLFQPPRDEIKDMPLEGWGSPLQPVKPFGPPSAEPRRYQIQPGQNLIYTPRPDAEYTAADLRALATYPLARICLENVKDVLINAPRQIMAKAKPGESKKDVAERSKGDATLKKLNDFFDRPDRDHDWSEWLRPLLDDMLVGDWASVLIRKTRGGEIVEIPRINGAMIQRIVDKNGWTPMPPDPAYAQIWWGVPYVEMTTDQLVYKPRNISARNTLSSELYGMSPTEQVAAEIEIGIQRLMFILAYYTEGSVPGILQVVPKGTPPEKVLEALAWMNSELAGNLAKRRQIRAIQGWAENPKEENIIETKKELLSDPFDDQHMRRVAFAYGTSPQRLAKMMNRASSEQSDDSAELEGTRPYFVWVKSLVDCIIQIRMGMKEYELSIDPTREPDIKKQMETYTGYVAKTIYTPNQIRDKLGEDPDPSPNADKLGVITATGFITLDQQQEAHEMNIMTQKKQAEKPVVVPVSGNTPVGGKPNGKPKPADGEGAQAKVICPEQGRAPVYGFVGGVEVVDHERGIVEVSKISVHETRRAVIHPGRIAPRSLVAKHELEKILKKQFAKMNKKTVRLLRRFSGIASKAGGGNIGDDDVALQEILNAIAADWEKIADAAESSLQEAAQVGSDLAAVQLDITSEDMLERINETAKNYASRRAAEMVGKRRTAGGDLVDNPDARWAISDTTREKLKQVIEDVFAEENPTLADVEARIMDAGIFDDERATMIARTEIANAQVNSNLLGWKESGMVKAVSWQTSADHDGDDVCDENEEGSPYAITEVPEFPAHPNCECAIVLELLEGEEEEEEE